MKYAVTTHLFIEEEVLAQMSAEALAEEAGKNGDYMPVQSAEELINHVKSEIEKRAEREAEEKNAKSRKHRIAVKRAGEAVAEAEKPETEEKV